MDGCLDLGVVVSRCYGPFWLDGGLPPRIIIVSRSARRHGGNLNLCRVENVINDRAGVLGNHLVFGAGTSFGLNVRCFPCVTE